MKKNVKQVFCAIICLFSATTFAQQTVNDPVYLNNWRMGFGLNLGYPLSSETNFLLGADARIQYDLTQKTSLTLTTGYNHIFTDVTDVGYIPLKAGFKGFLGNSFYLMGEVGAGFGTKSGMGTSFLWTPSIGYATKHVDISVRYEKLNDFDLDHVTLRLAYGFKL